jgi:hypothetical protein
MGGWLWWGGGVLGMVLQLAAKAGKVVAGVASEQDEKYGAGGDPIGGGWQRPFKGGRRDARGGGSRVSGDAWGGAGARERGPECGGGSGASGVRGARWAATG